MEILLIRHAQPEIVREGTGPADPGLTNGGQRQAKTMATTVADGPYGAVTAVVSSTQRRARETAEPLAQALGHIIETDKRLAELDVEWTTYGVGGETYPTRAGFYRALNGGEWLGNTFDPSVFARRVRDGVEAVIERHPQGVVAVVCHGGVISAYLAWILDLPSPFFVLPDHCSISRVLVGVDGYREILSVNESMHMRLP